MKFINIHTHSSINRADVLEIVNRYPRQADKHARYFSIGIHPWYIEEEHLAEDLKIIESKIIDTDCLAIGECGLDKRSKIDFALQIKVFELQLAIAEKNKIPMIIHCVAAFQELIEIKKKLSITVPLIIHGFSKNGQIANQLLDHDFYLSFGKSLLKNEDLRTVFQSVPNDRFFLETDTMSTSITDIYDLAANYKEVSVIEISEYINFNFEKVFDSRLSNNII